MKETKPTANAATTVVSTPPVIGGRRRRARRRAGPRPPRGAARRRRRAGRGLAAPAARGDHDAPDPDHHQHDRHEPGGEVEAARGRVGEHARPVLGDERGLDLLLVLAERDLAPDERPLLVGDRRRGHVERRVALDAHDLVLDVGQRGPRRGAGREHEQQRDEDEPRDHAFSPSSGGRVLSSHAWSTGPAALGGDPPAAVDHERLGEGARAVAVGELPVPVTEAGVREPEAVDELQRRVGRSW